MKKLMMPVLCCLVLAMGCSKDENVAPTAQNPAGTKIQAMSVNLSSIPDHFLPHVECLPEGSHLFQCGGGSMQGTISEIGQVVREESRWKVTGCEAGSDPNKIKEYISGRISSDSGHCFLYTGIITIDYSVTAVYGTLYIEGGSGKFSKSSGKIDIAGQVNLATGSWTWTGNGNVKLSTP